MKIIRFLYNNKKNASYSTKNNYYNIRKLLSYF